MEVAAKAPSDAAFTVCTPPICLDTSRLKDKLAPFSRTRLRFHSQWFDEPAPRLPTRTQRRHNETHLERSGNWFRGWKT
jgi:hypothetical protein